MWLRGFGELARVGVEGTSSYGAGLVRYLRQVGVSVEVNRPDRRGRRVLGRSAHLVQEHAEAGVAAPPVAERVVGDPARISAAVHGLCKAGLMRSPQDASSLLRRVYFSMRPEPAAGGLIEVTAPTS